MENEDNKILSKMKKYLNKSLPTEVKTSVTYQSKKTGDGIPTKRLNKVSSTEQSYLLQ